MRIKALLGLGSLLAVFVVAAPARAQFPGTNGVIVFTDFTDCNAPVTTCIGKMDANGANRSLLLNRPGDHVHVSPNGLRILFDGPHGGKQHILTATINGRRLTDVTPKGIDDEDAAWSPSGRAIVFSNQTNTTRAGLYRIKADGTHLKRLTGPADGPEEPDWSVNGQLVFHKAGDNFTMPAAGGTATDIGAGGAASWSPDGNTIVCNNNTGIAVVDATGTLVHQLTTNAFDDHPVFSPDGLSVAFDRSGDIYVVPADGSGSPVDIGSGNAPGWQPV